MERKADFLTAENCNLEVDRLRAQVAELKTENERLERKGDYWRDTCKTTITERDELKRQNAEISVNAERYLWIRDAANGEPYASEFHPCIKLSLDTKTDNDFCAEYSLDKAIDAAKGASNGNAEV